MFIYAIKKTLCITHSDALNDVIVFIEIHHNSLLKILPGSYALNWVNRSALHHMSQCYHHLKLSHGLQHFIKWTARLDCRIFTLYMSLQCIRFSHCLSSAALFTLSLDRSSSLATIQTLRMSAKSIHYIQLGIFSAQVPFEFCVIIP